MEGKDCRRESADYGLRAAATQEFDLEWADAEFFFCEIADIRLVAPMFILAYMHMPAPMASQCCPLRCPAARGRHMSPEFLGVAGLSIATSFAVARPPRRSQVRCSSTAALPIRNMNVSFLLFPHLIHTPKTTLPRTASDLGGSTRSDPIRGSEPRTS